MKTISKLVLAGALIASLGCGSEAEEPAATAPAAPAADEPAGTAPAAAPTPAEAGGAICARAAECCTAYVEAMVAAVPTASANMNVQATCAAVRQAASSGAAGVAVCQAAIQSWREGLASLEGVTVPAACQ